MEKPQMNKTQNTFEQYNLINVHVYGISLLIKIITTKTKKLPLRLAGTTEWCDLLYIQGAMWMQKFFLINNSNMETIIKSRLTLHTRYLVKIVYGCDTPFLCSLITQQLAHLLYPFFLTSPDLFSPLYHFTYPLCTPLLSSPSSPSSPFLSTLPFSSCLLTHFSLFPFFLTWSSVLPLFLPPPSYFLANHPL